MHGDQIPLTPGRLKWSNARGGGMLKLRFDRYISLPLSNYVMSKVPSLYNATAHEIFQGLCSCMPFKVKGFFLPIFNIAFFQQDKSYQLDGHVGCG